MKGGTNQPPQVRYDASANTQARSWRCYDPSALTSDGLSYNKTRRSKAFCSQHDGLLALIAEHCKESAGVSSELQEWPEGADAAPVCARKPDQDTWPPYSPLPTPHGACYEPSRCSAFANVSLVLQTSHAERVPLLVDYGHWFGSVHFAVFGARGEDDEQCQLCRTAIGRASHPLPALRLHCVCLTLARERPIAYGRLKNGTDGKRRTRRASPMTAHAQYAAAMLQARDDARARGLAIRGVLSMHFDVLLNVRRFQGVPLDEFVWSMRAGLASRGGGPPCCYPITNDRGPAAKAKLPRGVEPPRHFFAASWRNGYDVAARAVAALTSRATPQELCIGWSDLVYVPRRWVGSLAGLLSGALKDVHNELATPTAINIVLGGRRARRWRLLSCTGSASDEYLWEGRLFPPSSFERCGHRLNYGPLRTGRVDPYQQAALASMLSPTWRPTKYCNLTSKDYHRLRCIAPTHAPAAASVASRELTRMS